MNRNNNKKPKFNQMWSNQTNFGKKFGLSAIAVGKLLIEAGLKDPITKQATEKAISEGYAKSTPLKDGTPYFMWSIEEVRPLIAKDHEPISKVDYYVRRVQDALKQGQELDKIDRIRLLVCWKIVPMMMFQKISEKK